MRSVSSVALHLLRALEEMLIKGATHNLIVRTRSEVALYVLNHKRAHLRGLEERFRVTLTVSADATVTGQVSYIIDRGEQVHSVEAAKALADAARREMPIEDVVEDEEAEIAEESAEAELEVAEEHAPAAHEAAHEGAPREGAPEGERDGSRRRRRRGRGGRGRGGEPREPREGGPQQFTHDTVPEHAVAHEDHDAGASEEDIAGEQGERPPAQGGSPGEGGENRDGRHRRRRGRRGGRRNRRRGNGEAPPPASARSTNSRRRRSSAARSRMLPTVSPAFESVGRDRSRARAFRRRRRRAGAGRARASRAKRRSTIARAGIVQRRRPLAGFAAAATGDLEHRGGGERHAQARLVGQALLR